MGRTFLVLRCFSCHTFQVQQEVKAKKWSCKVCGWKQSFVKIYGNGSAADCRNHVQKLNMMRGEREAAILSKLSEQHTENDCRSIQESPEEYSECDYRTIQEFQSASNADDDENTAHDNDTIEGIEVTTDPQIFHNARKKKTKSTSKQLRYK
ncbi:uncharacterized protein TRIADDRAFT_61072 [Trichoplax adhaerens]|uniref:MRN complex-interacting protein N-terminal domain-containing protein n=1 Tax=Trichoplax adhaerens TaxID=10228 RepID=B3S9Y7_TRIAD|nr:hypothetical protein TRIADDRAFT_61072 [Trichoplax adhaerens]EDV20419.1 hypothetical protein TRIADDRAFT_61072 [Trichoplax adhaerens]|eukprot:XP_002117113.1 hypothetical protein TRIADDRAFT_61072 [Trichoplax adhaerens]